MDTHTTQQRKVILAILDGWGYSPKNLGNTIAQANLPTISSISQAYLMTLLQASGLAVGLSWGEPGNSEVGHLNIGAGRIVEQYLPRINKAIESGTFFTNEALVGAFEYAKSHHSRVHLLGLLTSGSVHAALNHIVALLDLAGHYPEVPLFLHLFLDGKDSGLQEGVSLLAQLQKELQSRGYGQVATLIGRKMAMDRDNQWPLTQQAYELITSAQGMVSENLITTLRDQYRQGLNDQIMPAIVGAEAHYDGVYDNDALIFFNFREDAIRQLTRAFVEPDFTEFARKSLPGLYVTTMTSYLASSSAHIAFPLPDVPNTLAEVLSQVGKQQLHITETEKYAHVTYFFNGLHDQPFPGESDILIESIKDSEHSPALKSQEIADRVVDEMRSGPADVIVVNFPNGDILAHTGDFRATVAGIEAVDRAVGLLLTAALEHNAILIVTADHGNAEVLTYQSSGEAETRHDPNPVPFYLIAKEYQHDATSTVDIHPEIGGILADIAPTILELMALPQPAEMTGKSLLPMFRQK